MKVKASVVKCIETKHSDVVNDAQVDFYGRRMATCSSDGLIHIVDISKEEHPIVTTLDGHEGPVWQVAWSDPSFGVYLASCSHDTKAIIWKEENSGWMKDYVLVSHLSSTSSVTWAPTEHGLSLAVSSLDGTVTILSLNENSLWESVKILDVDRVGCFTVCWGPPFRCLSQGKSTLTRQIAAAGVEGLVKIYRLSANKIWIEEEILSWEQDAVRCVAWCHNTASSLCMLATSSQNGSVIMWSKEDDSQRNWKPTLVNVFSEPVWHISWSEVGNILAVSWGEQNVSLWKNTLDGKFVCVSNLPELDAQ